MGGSVWCDIGVQLSVVLVANIHPRRQVHFFFANHKSYSVCFWYTDSLDTNIWASSWDYGTPEPLYNMVLYKTVLDITRIKAGPKWQFMTSFPILWWVEWVIILFCYSNCNLSIYIFVFIIFVTFLFVFYHSKFSIFIAKFHDSYFTSFIFSFSFHHSNIYYSYFTILILSF